MIILEDLPQDFYPIYKEGVRAPRAFAERLAYLGGTPTTKPDPIFVGETLKEMIERDKSDEETAIGLYKAAISLAYKEEDITTARLFRIIPEE